MKDFENWNKQKKLIHEKGKNKFYHERDIWWCSLGINIGFEQDGTGKNFDRPVLVIKGFNKETFFAVVLTGRTKEGQYFFPLGAIAGREASAILSQVRIVDTKRLIRKIDVLDEETFKKLKEALQNTLL